LENTPSIKPDFQKIFWARHIAVVGASSNPTKLGHTITKNLLAAGYKGKVYPINPSGEDILGLPSYKNLESVPGDIDLVVFCVAGSLIPQMLEKAALKSVGGAIVVSGGFREVGNTDLEKELHDAAEKTGIRLIGPNCQGINFTPNHMCASWPPITKPGGLAVISQSGTIAATLAGWAEEEGMGISGVVSLGNQIDLCETDFLQAFGEDDQTRVIAMYIEGVKDGRRFMDAVRKIDKPIIVLKSGRTPGGEKAAASHTRSLAGRDDVFSGICRQLGIIRAENVEELYDYAKGFAKLPLPKGPRLMIVTSSGGSGILAIDVAEKSGLCIPALGKELTSALKEGAIPASTVLSNPLDLTGSAVSEDYLEALRILEESDAADLYLLIFGDPIPGSAEKLEAMYHRMTKPVGICYLGGGSVQTEEMEQFFQKKIPVYPTPERAARLLAALYDKQIL
jgi:acyl-CoA synthetase (NDP forming)